MVQNRTLPLAFFSVATYPLSLFVKLFISIAATLVATPSLAMNVSPEMHEMCKEAKDYAGCVKAMTTDVSIQKIDQTNRPGLQQEMGNACPSGFAYAGNGKCRSIVCRFTSIFGGNEKALSGKGHTCEGKLIETGRLFGRASLRWGNDFINTVSNPNCPQREPAYGALSSCTDTGSGGRMDQQLKDVLPSDIRDSKRFN